MTARSEGENFMNRRIELGALALLLLAFWAGGGMAFAEAPSGTEAAWLFDRAGLAEGLADQDPTEIGAVGLDYEPIHSGRKNPGIPMLMSLVLPGAGEAYLGYKRGYFMAAADILAWVQVKKYNSDGADMRDDYYAFADEHWSEDRLLWSYNTDENFPPEPYEYYGLGWEYIYEPDPDNPINPPTSVDELGTVMPLWVSKEDDLREYYENLGKWDQFVFGWDDFTPVEGWKDPGYLYPIEDLRWDGVSENRDIYRVMRKESNDAFKTRDRWLYVNIGLRVVSVMQVAYLQGLLGGGPAQQFEVAGYGVRVQAVPHGFSAGHVAARVSF